MSAITTKQFETIAKVAQERWGLHLTEKKIQLVNNRINKHLRETAFSSIEEYLDHVTGSPTSDELLVFFDLLSTNVTSFFREIEHFHFLERELYTPLAKGNLTRAGKKVRLWSAACSTGAEPYSMAIQAMQLMPDLKNWDFKILATDLSNSALENARAASYPEAMVENLERSVTREYFDSGADGTVTVKPSVRKHVTVEQLNLMDRFPVKGPFDVIFLRNVMIYFDKPTRERLVEKMYSVLGPGGIFAIGSAETLSGLKTDFKMAQPAVYIK